MPVIFPYNIQIVGFPWLVFKVSVMTELMLKFIQNTSGVITCQRYITTINQILVKMAIVVKQYIRAFFFKKNLEQQYVPVHGLVTFLLLLPCDTQWVVS